MKHILIMTGPAAAGKNTISQIISQKREKCAVIDVDIIRQMYNHPHKAPWEGEEGKLQQKIGVKNACILANNFMNNNIDVIILDVVTDETAKIYRNLLPQGKIVLLLPSYDEAFKRFSQRAHTISEEEFKIVYEWQRKLTIYDEKIDNTNLKSNETAQKVNEYLL